MPVNPFDPADLLKIFAYGAVLSIPVIVIVAMIWRFIREADAAKETRGFEVKQSTGESPVPREKE